MNLHKTLILISAVTCTSLASALDKTSYSFYAGASYNYSTASVKSGFKELSDPQKVFARKDYGYTGKIGYKFENASLEAGYSNLLDVKKTTAQQVTATELSQTEAKVKLTYAAFNYSLPKIFLITPKLTAGIGVISDKFYYLQDATRVLAADKNKMAYLVGGSLEAKVIGLMHLEIGLKNITGSSIYKTITKIEMGLNFYI